ncbi:MAG: hypothetical protein GX440_06665 [Propionibacterium sp.]|nr:hypothetical protein [Propionibacterium sp.]
MKKVRRDIANSLNSNVFWLAADGMWALMESLWTPDDPTGFDLFTGNDLRAQIRQHVFSNDDWDATVLFGELADAAAQSLSCGWLILPWGTEF